jgi:hypothetical protein
MNRDFFGPSPEEQQVVLIEQADNLVAWHNPNERIGTRWEKVVIEVSSIGEE